MKKTISRKITGGVIGIVFVTAAFFGVHLTMNMDPQGVMKNCPLFVHMENVCTMSVTEHIEKWQQLFTATMQSSKFLVTFFLLISLAFVAFPSQFSFFNLLNFQTVNSRAGPHWYSLSFLLRAFGRGILRKRE